MPSLRCGYVDDRYTCCVRAVLNATSHNKAKKNNKTENAEIRKILAGHRKKKQKIVKKIEKCFSLRPDTIRIVYKRYFTIENRRNLSELMFDGSRFSWKCERFFLFSSKLEGLNKCISQKCIWIHWELSPNLSSLIISNRPISVFLFSFIFICNFSQFDYDFFSSSLLLVQFDSRYN